MNQKKKYNINRFTELLRKYTDGESNSVLSNLRVSDKIVNIPDSDLEDYWE